MDFGVTWILHWSLSTAFVWCPALGEENSSLGVRVHSPPFVRQCQPGDPSFVRFALKLPLSVAVKGSGAICMLMIHHADVKRKASGSGGVMCCVSVPRVFADMIVANRTITVGQEGCAPILPPLLNSGCRFVGCHRQRFDR